MSTVNQNSRRPDPIDKNTWKSIVSLPDDVSITTSERYGSVLRTYWSVWNEWNCLVGALQEVVRDPARSPIAHVASNVTDEIQASIYNALIGFYRIAFASLRNVAEQMTIGLCLELGADPKTFQTWLKGAYELKFGWAADNVPKHSIVANLELHLTNKLGDSLFRQKTRTQSGGFARRLYSELSDFTHGGPAFTNADLWRGSNGPIFVSSAFEKWAWTFAKTYALGVLEAKLAQAAVISLGFGSSLSIKDLFKQVAKTVPRTEDGFAVLQEALNFRTLWR